MATALVNKGVRLAQLDKSEEAIAVYDEVVKRFGEASDLQLQVQVAMALVNKGVRLAQLDKSEEAIAVYDEVVKRFGESSDLQLWERVAKALFNKGDRLGRLDKSEEAIAVYDEVVKRFGESSDLQLWERVAKALFNKGNRLGRLDKSEESIAVYDEVVKRFGESSDLPLREKVAKALFNKGLRLGRLGKAEEAIAVYDEIVKRFGESPDLSLEETVAKSLLFKAGCLLDADHWDEAQALVSRVEKEYLGTEELRSKLASHYAYLHSRFATREEPVEEGLADERTKTALDITRKDLASNLRIYLTLVLRLVAPETQEKYFDKIKQAEDRIDRFIHDGSRFSSDFPFLLVLREWNSYTPVIPGQEEADRGGGYFIRHAGEGIVIDPGYDFIEKFHRAGGLLCDIDHVIVTHAHGDHTAELEDLLMLFHRRWTAKNAPNRKPVSLYLSAGVQRKFAGLLDLCDAKYKRVVTLCPTEKGFEQRVRLNAETVLTVLPAYHEDVITRNSAVGLAFEFATKSGTRKVVFTGDSGLYPLKLGEYGQESFYDDQKESPVLDVGEGKALYELYPEPFHKPDLLVAHIGSIKESEFRPQEAVQSRDDEGRWYYDNHLGLLGTLTMLHQLNPEAAVISEFGSELKGFHIELVEKLGEALHERQQDDSSDERETFVIPGDLTTAYEIANRRFLCHDSCEFADPADLDCRPAADYAPEWNDKTKRYDAITINKKDATRSYLFDQNSSPGEDGSRDNRSAEEYYRKFFNHELPYHKK